MSHGSSDGARRNARGRSCLLLSLSLSPFIHRVVSSSRSLPSFALARSLRLCLSHAYNDYSRLNRGSFQTAQQCCVTGASDTQRHRALHSRHHAAIRVLPTRWSACRVGGTALIKAAPGTRLEISQTFRQRRDLFAIGQSKMYDGSAGIASRCEKSVGLI